MEGKNITSKDKTRNTMLISQPIKRVARWISQKRKRKRKGHWYQTVTIISPDRVPRQWMLFIIKEGISTTQDYLASSSYRSPRRWRTMTRRRRTTVERTGLAVWTSFCPASVSPLV
ncbi:hypothetical protein RRG08_038734 [Elysia crispata]|uniref:Uncharacterized protein n=1 Tax=Elysia crispata TaxID=231223 RepID=A0AAE0YPY4_9GAST|nr:hypothetical protein RRG08_038734 [Elysia crispata]